MMKAPLERLWNEHFAEECAAIDTEEERALMKKVAAMYEAINGLLTAEESNALERYTEALCELQSSFLKKAFFKGCEFSAAFLLDMILFGEAP